MKGERKVEIVLGHRMGKRGKLCQEASMKECVRGSVDEVRCEEGSRVE